jgi:hypothetical protein
MSQTGYTPIQLYRATISGAVPVAGNLVQGELAFNLNDADFALYALNTSGVVKRIMNNPAGLKYPTVDGTANYVLKTDGAGTLSWTPQASGTVTSVTGTSPVVSSGGATPAISIPAATTSASGYLTNTDWNTFNGKYSTGGALGTPASGTLTNCTADGTNAVGYKNIPKSGSDKVTSYPLVTTDVGKYISVGSSGSITVPDATFSAGDAVSIFNNTSGNITMTMTITTAYIGGTDADKATITLATRGLATILFLSGTVCVVSGNVS